jgi:hypothetical protein
MVQDRSGENIGRGISQFGSAMGDGIGDMFDRMKKEKEKEKEDGKESTKILSTLMHLDPKNADKYKANSLAERRGALEGVMIKSRMDAEEAQRREAAAREKHYEGEAKRRMEEEKRHMEEEKRRGAEEGRRQEEERRRGNQETATPNFFNELSRMREAITPSNERMEKFYEGEPGVMPREEDRPQPRPFDALRDVPAAAGSTGYNIPPGQFDDLVKAFTPPKQGWNLQPGVTITHPDGTTAYPTSPGSLQIPSNKGGRPERKPGAGPIISESGTHYWDDNKQTWIPMPQPDPFKAAMADKFGVGAGGGGGGGGGRGGADRRLKYNDKTQTWEK